MNRKPLILALILGLLLLTVTFFQSPPARAQFENTPTFTPIPTATLGGPTVFVPELVNVRMGPGTNYEQIGVMVSGQIAAAIGRTRASEWIQIEYIGSPTGIAWVYAPLVQLRAGNLQALPEQAPPATPTLLPTATLSTGPGGPVATRLPTFTAAPPVAQPVFPTPEVENSGFPFPPILAIAGLLVIGLIAGAFAIIRNLS